MADAGQREERQGRAGETGQAELRAERGQNSAPEGREEAVPIITYETSLIMALGRLGDRGDLGDVLLGRHLVEELDEVALGDGRASVVELAADLSVGHGVESLGVGDELEGVHHEAVVEASLDGSTVAVLVIELQPATISILGL